MTEPLVTFYGPRAYADHPPFLYADYRSTVKRSPAKDMVRIVQTLSETTGPGMARAELSEDDADLTTNAGTGSPAIGERIIVTGRVLDEGGDPVRRCAHRGVAAQRQRPLRALERDGVPGPARPQLPRCRPDVDRRRRRIPLHHHQARPYPWANHPNAWRPSHIHFSLLGTSWGSRLVTQMYFEGDPLLPLDPIFNSVPAHARDRLVASYDHDVTEENWAIGYRWDIVLRGPMATPLDL